MQAYIIPSFVLIPGPGNKLFDFRFVAQIHILQVIQVFIQDHSGWELEAGGVPVAVGRQITITHKTA